MWNFIKANLTPIKEIVKNIGETVSTKVTEKTNTVTKFVSKHNLVSIILLGIIIYFEWKIVFFTMMMYNETKAVDSNWVLFTSGITALLTIFVTFYCNNTSKENINRNNNDMQENINRNNNETELQKQFIDLNGNGINDCDEEDMSNGDTNPENLDLI